MSIIKLHHKKEKRPVGRFFFSVQSAEFRVQLVVTMFVILVAVLS